MNAPELITHLRSRKAVIDIHGDKLKIRVSENVMTPGIIADIRSHKSEIIDYLKSANEETPNKYAYHFELKNNAGGGTWVSDKPPSEARKNLADFYIDREINVFELIN